MKDYILLSLLCGLYLVLLTDNCQPIRPAGSDPAGTLTADSDCNKLNINLDVPDSQLHNLPVALP